MTDLLFPTWARISAQRIDAVSNTASARSIFTGAIRTVGRGGDRFRWSITTSNASDREAAPTRRALQALRVKARGQANRIWFAPPHVQRGSFPSQELLANNTFENGTTGFTNYNASSSEISVSDRVMRVKSKASSDYSGWHQPGSVVPGYQPYVLRSFIADGKGSAAFAAGPALYLGTFGPSDYSLVRGLRSISGVSNALSGTGAQYPALLAPSPAGTHIDVHYTSLSRCFQLDNGQNLLADSDQFGNATWNKVQATYAANTTAAPDETNTADGIIDNAVSSTHYVEQTVTVSSAADDFAFTVALKAASLSWVAVQLVENSAGSSATAYVNLSSGTIGSSSAVTNFSNVRTFISSIGSGWYSVSIVARKTNAATSLSARIYLATGDGVASYVGAGQGVYAWRATLAQSGVPARLVQTTSAATSGALQSGNSLHVKGLPVSTNGLLLPGDLVQIGAQLNMVTASLDSDAAGLGYLQCAYPWRTSPADNAPVIVNTPMARCVLADNVGGWSDQPGIFSDFEFVLEEALDE